MIDRREIPAVNTLLRSEEVLPLIANYGRPLVLDCVRTVLAEIREKSGGGRPVPDRLALFSMVENKIHSWLSSSLVPVINATGVVLHTNLGRAPLSKAARQAVSDISAGYCTLEYDLENGDRGSRSTHVESLLTRLCRAEAALVVNNNAAAVLLVLSALASRKRVIISRTQLVEIGGGFRVPEVMRQSGAKLVEIGTTNRVHLSDYEEALSEPTALVMCAHHSNFKLVGFTSEPSLPELVALSQRFDVPVVDDLGSGALLDTARFGLPHEPTVQESLQAGVDLVCFSGDKLLGGPQAGIIVGRAQLISKLRKNPLARAVRADKTCLAALAATLLHYLKDEAEREIPVWKMIGQTPEDLQKRAEAWREALDQGEVIPGLSTVGGGSLPEETLPTRVLAFTVPRPNRFLARLRTLQPPIVAIVQEEKVILDPRTVLPEQEAELLHGLEIALGKKV
ncbi:MAG TPA: L-seryl-tRNA(Sec) selenium transferase [Anaerolineaceae bacterium]|nr:L-seryl-tRNA(Sec) selenium transferase [Anaerolineaceae bacterium]